MKKLIKRLLFGSVTGPRKIRAGLLRGLMFRVDPHFKSQRLMGTDESEIANVVREFSAQVKTAVDIGANDGWYTLYFAAQPGIQKVFACEPDAKCIGELKDNLAMNTGATAKVSIISRFVGTKADPDWISLDEILRGTPEPHLLKIDVDGGELGVLQSASELLLQHNPLVIVETHSQELERDCIAFLSERNYECTIIPNGWYRCIIPEERPIAHNRWFSAKRKTPVAASSPAR